MDGQSTGGANPLSCTNCRRRKVKCNKTEPCTPCQKSGIECVFPNRVRTAKRREGGLKVRNNELLRRIGRLESLVTRLDDVKSTADIPGRAAKPVEKTSSSLTGSSGLTSGDKAIPTLAGLSYAGFIKHQEDNAGYLSGDFWSSLSHEVDGLRQLLEEQSDDEPEGEESIDSQTPEDKLISPAFAFAFGSPDSGGGDDVPYPSDEHRSILFRFYFANVHPVFRILHQVTAYLHLANPDELLDPATGRFAFSSLEAIAFAIYLAAVTSMSPEKCLSLFNIDKSALLVQYRRGLEIALTKADFLNSVEIVTLQAFVIFVMVMRTHRRDRSSWALIALAVRLAQGLGMHKDGDGRSFPAFEAESRRRLWWCVVLLDMIAAEDRGSEPVIQGNSFNTRMPCNIDDDDYNYSTMHPLPDRKGQTGMTFCLISMDVGNTIRQLDFAPPASEPQVSALRQKEDKVKQCSGRIENVYLAECDPADPRTWLNTMLGRMLIFKLWLNVQYPLSSRITAAHEYPKGEGLKTAMGLLELRDSIDHSNVTSQFDWWFDTYVPWHAVAVALVELCKETEGPLVEKTWSIVDRNFSKWSSRIADGPDGKLWQPIKKLLKRAQAARGASQKVTEFLIAPSLNLGFLPGQENIIPDPNLLNNIPGPQEESMDMPMAMGHMALDDRAGTSHPDIGLSAESQFTFGAVAPGGMVQGNEPPLSGQVDWNDWNDFILDMDFGAGVLPNLDDTMPMQNWTG